MTGLDSSQTVTDEASLHAEELHLQSHSKFPATEDDGQTTPPEGETPAARPEASGISDPA
jgi:hypothetical protein